MSSVSSVLFLTSLAIVSSTPTIYDQRQDGRVNVHADLENFLIVIATSGKGNEFGMMGSLALQQLLEARQKVQQSPSLEKFEYKLEESSSDESKEPYSVEILRLRKEEQNKNIDPTHDSEQDQKKSILIQEHGKTVIPLEAEEASKVESEDPKTVEVKVVNLSRRRSEHNSKHEDVQVKVIKEEPVKEVKEVDKKELSSEEGKVDHPVKLLGDAIEDCGPGMIRDKLGICVTYKQFN